MTALVEAQLERRVIPDFYDVLISLLHGVDEVTSESRCSNCDPLFTRLVVLLVRNVAKRRTPLSLSRTLAPSFESAVSASPR